MRVIPARADQAEPEQITRLLGVWHQLLVQRWFNRILWGQASISLEVRTAPDAEGDLSGYLSIVCPVQELKARLQDSLDRIWRAPLGS